MTEKELLNKIKSRGYWKVNFTPLKFNESIVPERPQLIDIVEKSRVKLRGWDYPHLSHWETPQSREAVIRKDYIEGGCDWEAMIELWRFYQSGQFIHLFAIREDWFAEDTWVTRPDLKNLKSGDALEIVSAIYTATEIFEFAHRLTKLGIYDEGIKISIQLVNTKGRALKVFDFMRAGLFRDYKAHDDVVHYEREFTNEEILSDHKKLAIDAISWILESFGWTDRPRSVFEKDQRNLYERRF